MTKTVGTITFKYSFESERIGAKYTLDGTHYVNGGEFAEIAVKSVRGYAHKKDANTRYDVASDIEETHTSIKSSKATLTSAVLGNDFDTIVNRYFETVASTNFDYAIIENDIVTIYNMDKAEFRKFLEKFSAYDKYRSIVRIKTTSKNMKWWFETQI